MRNNRQAAVLTALISILAAGAAGATETTQPAIECEARPGYHLCEANAEGENLQHEWTVTGDLAINLASGPMASIRCEAGQAGAVWLQTRGPEGEASVCVELECGAENTPTCKG